MKIITETHRIQREKTRKMLTAEDAEDAERKKGMSTICLSVSFFITFVFFLLFVDHFFFSASSAV